MARNEEKQLARLNRFYLQKQREEELKKRPPRPKLETLTTTEELRKWLPSIKRDIDFYVKQMEVPCYRDEQIEEFSRRIGQLKGEYKAYLRKLHQLNPEDKIAPWTERPYAVKKPKTPGGGLSGSNDVENSPNKPIEEVESTSKSSPSSTFIPLSTPLLVNDDQNLHKFGYNNRKPVVPPDYCTDLSDESMNQPLMFDASFKTSSKLTERSKLNTMDSKVYCCVERNESSKPSHQSFESAKNDDTSASDNNNLGVDRGLLNLPYTDSSSSGDET